MTSWKQDDLEPPLAGVATSAGVGTSLAAATAVTVRVRRPDGTLIERAATLGNQATAPGSWSLPWQAGDLAQLGRHRVELEVTWPPGRQQTFPPSNEAAFRVYPPLP